MGEEEEEAASWQIIFEAACPFLLPCAVIMHASGSNAGRERKKKVISTLPSGVQLPQIF